MILHIGIDGDRAHASDDGTFVKDIAPHDAAIDLRDDAVETGSGKQCGKQAGAGLRPRKIAGEIV
jgi:hypothetical protein